MDHGYELTTQPTFLSAVSVFVYGALSDYLQSALVTINSPLSNSVFLCLQMSEPPKVKSTVWLVT